MKVDRHHDPVIELESRLLSELDFIAQQLRGKITHNVYGNSEGKQSKVITIEYDVRDKNEDTICLLYTSPSPRDRQKSRMPSSA